MAYSSILDFVFCVTWRFIHSGAHPSACQQKLEPAGRDTLKYILLVAWKMN